MQQAIQEEPRRISAVVRHTGISKELVHHYIRQGLLPKSESRARYSEQQVRLLQQVRTLREDHNLPLELIRRLFSIFDFEPDRIESLTLSDSLSKRIGQFAQDGDLSSSKRLSADELIRETGVTRERLAEYEKTRLVAPLDQSEPCFGAYDVNVVSLCEHGVRLGIPFDAFRTIGSYVGIAFDLAHSEFYEVSADRALDADRILADLFVRRELASSFVQNVLAGLTQRRMQGLLQQARPQRASLDAIVFRPSPLFLRVHGIDEQIERSREAMRELPGDATLRLRLGWFLLHAGRYEEAAFFLTESLDKWPEDNSLRTALGCSFLLVGDRERGTQVLEQVVEAGAELPLAYTFLALSRFARPADTNTPESLIREAVPILQQVEKALALSDGDPSKHVDARIFCAWLLTALPPVFACHERGHGLLVDALETLRKGPADRRGAGWHERALVSAAHFLLESLSRPATPLPAAAPWTPAATTPSIEELQTLICRLDPACALAATAYLVEKESTPQKRSQETP